MRRASAGRRGGVLGGLLLVTGVALALAACRQEAGPVSKVEPAKLYAQMCANCHGADGKGNPDMAKIMPVKDLTSPETRAQRNETLERVIMAGRDKMPAFGGALTPRKIQALVGHIRRLGDKKE